MIMADGFTMDEDSNCPGKSSQRGNEGAIPSRQTPSWRSARRVGGRPVPFCGLSGFALVNNCPFLNTVEFPFLPNPAHTQINFHRLVGHLSGDVKKNTIF